LHRTASNLRREDTGIFYLGQEALATCRIWPLDVRNVPQAEDRESVENFACVLDGVALGKVASDLASSKSEAIVAGLARDPSVKDKRA
jgi:hypothetical protein